MAAHRLPIVGLQPAYCVRRPTHVPATGGAAGGGGDTSRPSPIPASMALVMQACMHASAAVAPARQAGRSAAALPSALPRRRRQPRLATQASASAVGAAATGTKRAFNFSAGPACLPLDVLETAQAELVDWHGSGMSVLEMSHRGPEFECIIAKAEKDLRALMKIPDNYKVRASLTRPKPRPSAVFLGDITTRSTWPCARELRRCDVSAATATRAASPVPCLMGLHYLSLAGAFRAGRSVHAVCGAAAELCARGCHRGLRRHRRVGCQVREKSSRRAAAMQGLGLCC